MPTPIFPTAIPNVKMEEYGFKPISGNIRTEMEVGLARVRRRYVSTPTEMNVAWELTRTQLGLFEKFYDTDLTGGSGWFLINLVNGTGQSEYTARFKEPYSVTTSGREFMWKVTAVLEVLSRPLPA